MINLDDIYKHYKGSNYRILCDKAIHTETNEELVVYTNGQGEVFARPYDMFHGYTEEGKKRFKKIDWSSSS